MLKKICLLSLFFVFISCNQLLAKDGIRGAVKASHAGKDSDVTETAVVTDNVNSNVYSAYGKVTKVEALEDQSAIVTIKGSKGELNRCKLTTQQTNFLHIMLSSMKSKMNVRCDIDTGTNIAKSVVLDNTATK
ncbi:MAG: hypothetical protein WCQ47_03575 [bacterium]